MAERPFQPVPNTPLVADPTGDAIWKRWLQGLQSFLGAAVRGPGSSTDNAVARWDGTTGTFLNNSGVIIDDSNNVSGIVNLNASGTVTFSSGNITTGNTTAISLQTSGGTQAQITNTASADRYVTITGSNGGNPTIGTSAGRLNLSPAGNLALQIRDVASQANYLVINGTASGGQIAEIYADGADANVNINYVTKGSGGHRFYGDFSASTLQFAINRTANADRYITVTGSNGGNPTIGTSAGDLAVSSNLRVLPGSTSAPGIEFSGFTDVGFCVDANGINLVFGGSGSILQVDGTRVNVSVALTADSTISAKNKIYPGTDAAAFQTAAGIYAGTGAPNNANGSDGDFYFRSDGGVLTTIYQRRAGAWVGIV